MSFVEFLVIFMQCKEFDISIKRSKRHSENQFQPLQRIQDNRLPTSRVMRSELNSQPATINLAHEPYSAKQLGVFHNRTLHNIATNTLAFIRRFGAEEIAISAPSVRSLSLNANMTYLLRFMVWYVFTTRATASQASHVPTQENPSTDKSRSLA